MNYLDTQFTCRDEIYALTAEGEQHLRGATTSLPGLALEMLVRIDGTLSMPEIQASMPAVGAKEFDATLRDLCGRRLFSVVETDRVAREMQASLDMLSTFGSDTADCGASSLKRSGFYVEIARERDSVRARAPGEKLCAVVVEDEPVLAKFIESYLSFEGFQVRLAANRAEILQQFNRHPPPDIVLLDVELPDADGFHVLTCLRQNKALNHVPIVMLTGQATREAVLKGMSGGADGYVTKPFEAETLMRAVRTVAGISASNAVRQPADRWGAVDTYARRA
jgi:two-component system OmpR family response regulator